jgi:DNA-binding transcriptional MerR regulator
VTIKRCEIVLCRSERNLLTLEALAASAEIHPGLVERFMEYGLIEPVEWIGPLLLFDAAAVPRLRMIMRLRRDIGVNLSGIGMILDLLDRLRTLQRENERLNAQR